MGGGDLITDMVQAPLRDSAWCFPSTVTSELALEGLRNRASCVPRYLGGHGERHSPRSASVLFFMSFCRRLVCSSSLKVTGMDTHPPALRQAQQGGKPLSVQGLPQTSVPPQALQEADHPEAVQQ